MRESPPLTPRLSVQSGTGTSMGPAPNVSEWLCWALTCVTPLGLLERAHAYKDRVANGEKVDHGLLAYPVLMAAGAILIHIAIIAFVMSDPRVVFVSGYMAHFLTPALNLVVFHLRILILALEGAFLWFLAKTARQTIHDAIELEVSNLEIKERQAELLMEGKMLFLKSSMGFL